MHLQTRLRLISVTNIDDATKTLLETLINTQVIAQGCLSCSNADWQDNGDVTCSYYNSAPPNWAVAIGCTQYDYLPF